MRRALRGARHERATTAAALVWGVLAAAVVMRRAVLGDGPAVRAEHRAFGHRSLAIPHVLRLDKKGEKLVDALRDWEEGGMPSNVTSGIGNITLKIGVTSVLSMIVEEGAGVVEANGGSGDWVASHAAGQRGLRTVIGLEEDAEALEDFSYFSWDDAIALSGRLGPQRHRALLGGTPEFSLSSLAEGEQGGVVDGGGVTAAVVHSSPDAEATAAALAGGSDAFVSGNIRYLFVTLDLVAIGGAKGASVAVAPALSLGLECAVLKGSGGGVPSRVLGGPLSKANVDTFWAGVEAARKKYIDNLLILSTSFHMALMCSKRDAAWTARGAEMEAAALARTRPPVRRGRVAPMFSPAQFEAALKVAEAQQAEELAAGRARRNGLEAPPAR